MQTTIPKPQWLHRSKLPAIGISTFSIHFALHVSLLYVPLWWDNLHVVLLWLVWSLDPPTCSLVVHDQQSIQHFAQYQSTSRLAVQQALTCLLAIDGVPIHTHALDFTLSQQHMVSLIPLTTMVFSICLISSWRFCTSASTCCPWLLRVVCTSYLYDTHCN